MAVFAFGSETGGVVFDNVERTRFVGVEERQACAETACFIFGADFLLFGDKGFQRFVGIADGVGRTVDGRA